MFLSPTHGCSGCGTATPPGALFCPKCGAATPTEISGGSGIAVLPRISQGGDWEGVQFLQSAVGDEYEILDRVGEGGFGVVYRAHDLKLKRQVAIKALRPELFAARALRNRFYQEAQAAARLRHPNIIPIFAVGEDSRVAFIVMPLIQGESLAALLAREGTLPAEEVRRILVEAAEGLQSAHEAGIVHRDIKPENIMLEGPQRRVLLMDFGIAKAIGGEDNETLTGSGVVLGTPAYMSPEQATGGAHVDARADIYSLGVVGYRMVAGVLPFEGGSAQEVMVRHLTEAPKGLAAMHSAMPSALCAAIMRCIEKKPENRWDSASELSVKLSERWVGQGSRSPLRLVWLSIALASIAGSILLGRSLLVKRFQDAPLFSSANRAWRSFSVTSAPQMASLDDSLLLVWTPRSKRLTLFNGDSWREVRGFPAMQPLQPIRVEGGGELVPVPPFFSVNDTTNKQKTIRFWTLAGDSALKADSISLPGSEADVRFHETTAGIYATSGAWFPGVPNRFPTLRRLGPGGWQVVPLPTRSSLTKVFAGTHSHAYVLGDFNSETTPDSILELDSVTGWRMEDIRTDSRELTEYYSGAATSTSAIVVGRACKPREAPDEIRPCRPLILQKAAAHRWAEIPITPDDVHLTFYNAVVTPTGEYYVWGRLTYQNTSFSSPLSLLQCPPWIACVWQVQDGAARAVRDLQGQLISDIASLHGVPFAITESGVLWARRRGKWRQVEAVASMRVKRVLVFGSNTIVLAGSDVRISPRRMFGFGSIKWREGDSTLTFSNAAALDDSLLYLLSDSGRILKLSCVVRTPFPEVHCREIGSVLKRRAVSDIGVSPDTNLMILTAAGLEVGDRDTSWVSVQVPTIARSQELRRIKPSPRGVLVVGRNGILVGPQVSKLRWIPIELGTALGLVDAMELDSARIVVLGLAGGTWKLAVVDATSGVLVRQLATSDSRFGIPSSLLALPNGGLLAAMYDNTGVTDAGWLEVWDTPALSNTSHAVALPQEGRVNDMTIDGASLYVVGDRGLAVGIPLDSIISSHP